MSLIDHNDFNGSPVSKIIVTGEKIAGEGVGSGVQFQIPTDIFSSTLFWGNNGNETVRSILESEAKNGISLYAKRNGADSLDFKLKGITISVGERIIPILD